MEIEEEGLRSTMDRQWLVEKLYFYEHSCCCFVEPATFLPIGHALYHEITPDESTRAKLPCDVIGSPAPTITWLKDGRLIEICHDRKVGRDRVDSFLIVYLVTE